MQASPPASLILGTLIWLAERYIRWVSTHFVLTTDRVIYRAGVVAKHGIEIPLERINTIFFSQRIFERMLGLGDLKIESASENGAQVLRGHPQPGAGAERDLRRRWRPTRTAASTSWATGSTGAARRPRRPRRRPAAVGAPSRSPSCTGCASQGALTDAEFEAKKAELLGRM